MKMLSLPSPVCFRRASLAAGLSALIKSRTGNNAPSGIQGTLASNALMIAFLAMASLASAQSIWTPTGTAGNWSTDANWTGGAPVESSTTTVTFFAGTTNVAANIVTANFTSTIDTGVTGATSTSFDLQTLVLNGRGDGTGKTVTIAAGAGVTAGLNFNGTSNSVTFNNPALGSNADLTYNITAPVKIANGLTINGVSNATISGSSYNRFSGVISGTGGVTKNGTGRVVLGANNTFSGGLTINGNLQISVNQSYTGGTTLNSGAVIFATGTPFASGTITLNAGTFAATASPTLGNNILIGGNLQIIDAPNIGGSNLILSGTVDLQGGTRQLVVAGYTQTTGLASTGNVLTMSGAVSNGGIIKDGRGTLVLSGTNTYSGGTTIKNGVLQFGTNASIPSTGTVTVTGGGALAVNTTSGNTTVSSWLSSGKLSTSSTGAIVLTGNSSETIDFATPGYGSLFLGASAASTFTGSIAPAGSTYRLGGGGSTLTLSNANTLTGGNSLVVGPTLTYTPVGIGTLNTTLAAIGSLGTVALGAANDLTGTTTVNSGGLTLTGAGAVAGSDVIVNRPTLNSTGAGFTPLAITSGTGTTTRAKSVTLNATVMTVAGTASTNTNDVITNALTTGSGLSTITLTPNATGNLVLTAGSLARSAGAMLLVRGVGFGTNTIVSQTANTSNVVLNATPTFTGSTGTSGTTMQIIPWAIGDATATGNGTDFLTYDSTTGLRMLTGSEYLTTFSSGNATQDNAKITANVAISAATTLNSLVLNGATTTVSGAGTLTLASGGLLSTSAATGAAISSGLAFGSNEAVITAATSSGLTLSGAVTGTAGLSKNGGGTLTITGAKAYSGVVTINAGTLSTNSLANGGSNSGVGAATGIATNLVLNGGTLTYTGAAVSSDRLFSIGIGGGAINASGTGALTLTNTGSMGFNGESGVRMLSIRGTGTGTLAAVVGDNGGATSVAKLDGGTWNLTGSSTYTGATYIVGDANNSAGTVSTNFLADGGQTSGIGASSNAATNLVISRGTFKYTGAAVSTDRLFSIGSTTSGTATLDASGTGAVNFTNTGAMGFFGGPATRSLVLNGTNTDDNTLAAAITNSGPSLDMHSTLLTKSGAGTWVVSGTNTYTGATAITAGTLKVGNAQALGVNSALTMTNAASTNLDLNGFDQSIGSLAGGGATGGNVILGSQTLTTGGNNTDTSYAGIISGTGGSLIKTGTGTQTLTAANTYTGATTISAGTLALDASGTIANSSGINLGTLGSQGTLDLTAKSSFAFGTGQTLSGYGTINIGAGKTVTIDGNLAPGNSAGVVTVTGDSALAGTTTTMMELAGNGGVAGTDFDKLSVSGALTFAGTLNIVNFGGYDIAQAGTYDLFGFASQSGNFSLVSVAGTALTDNTTTWSATNLNGNGFDYTFTLATGDLVVVATAVPEPATCAAIFGALALVAAVWRRRAALRSR